MLVGFAVSEKKIIGGFVSSKIFCVSIRIISEVLKMNLVDSGGTNVWFVPPDSEAGGYMSPVPPPLVSTPVVIAHSYYLRTYVFRRDMN